MKELHVVRCSKKEGVVFADGDGEEYNVHFYRVSAQLGAFNDMPYLDVDLPLPPGSLIFAEAPK